MQTNRATETKTCVIGSGMVGSIFKDVDGYKVQHFEDDYKNNWQGIINAAGVAGQARCDEVGRRATYEANVAFPLAIAKYCHDSFIPFVTLSTMAVYSHAPSPRTENSPVFPANLYTENKIAMEAMMPEDVFIFRLGMVVRQSGTSYDFGEKVKAWAVVEDVELSIINEATLKKAVRHVITDPTIAPGIYNLASESVHLPTFIKDEFGWDGEVVAAHSLNLSPAVVMDTTKAQERGLL